MSLDHVVGILQVGFSGFAFLMAYLSFGLLRAESKRDGTPRRAILRTIHRYLIYTVVLASLVLLGRFAEDAYRSRLQIEQDEALRTASDAIVCRDGLSRLVHADVQVATNYDSLLRAVQEDAAGCNTVLKALERQHRGER
jgi:hypothetical protein